MPCIPFSTAPAAYCKSPPPCIRSSLRRAARADIFQWEYINPADPSQGKRQSTTLAPDGAGVDAVPGADLSGRDLTMAYLIGADVRNANFYCANLTDANIAALRCEGLGLTSAFNTSALVPPFSFVFRRAQQLALRTWNRDLAHTNSTQQQATRPMI